MPRSSAIAIALFAKAPRVGMVKTRLARDLSPEAATEFHRRSTLAMWERLADWAELEAFFYCDVQWSEFDALAGRGRFRLQRGSDLGERMRLCLEELLADGYGKALIVGSDAPTLPSAQLDEAVAALDSVDVVLGPSDDGGFTLIGASRVVAAMFRGVTWSLPGTRKACLDSVEAAGLRAAETQAHGYDVDTLADLRRLALDAAASPSLEAWLRPYRGSESEQMPMVVGGQG